MSVYEAAATFKEVGAGVMMWGRTWRVLSLLGLDSAFRELAGATNSESTGAARGISSSVCKLTKGSLARSFSYDYRRADQGAEGHLIHRLELPCKFTITFPRAGAHTQTDESHLYHRAHFLDVLVDRLPKHIAHLGKRLQSYAQDRPGAPIDLKFVDGTNVTCDVLVGCDGIRSVVRRFMFEKMAAEGRPEMRDYIEPVWTGEITYRALIPAGTLPLRDGEKHPALSRTIIVSPPISASVHVLDPHARYMQYCGKNKVCYPMLYTLARD